MYPNLQNLEVPGRFRFRRFNAPGWSPSRTLELRGLELVELELGCRMSGGVVRCSVYQKIGCLEAPGRPRFRGLIAPRGSH